MILKSKKMTAKITKFDRDKIIEFISFGSNLLNNTNLSDGMNNWEFCGVDVGGGDENELQRFISVISPYIGISNTFRFTGTGTIPTEYGFRQPVKVEANKQYFASFYYKFNSAIVAGKNKLKFEIGTQETIIEQVDNEWHRFVFEFTPIVTETLDFCVAIFGDIQNISLDLLGFQMERSSRVTDWKMSQSDLISQMDDVRDKVGLLEEITQPERIVETVMLSEPYQSAFAQLPKYEDIADFANQGEMEQQFQLMQDYISQVDGDLQAQLSTLTSSIEQSAQNILMKFTMSTGINLIRNSTGFFATDFWTKSGSVQTVSSQEIEQKAIGSAFYMNSAGKLEQEIAVLPNTEYSFSFWEKKLTTGTTNIKLMNGTITTHVVGFTDTQISTNFTNPFIVKFKTKADQQTVKIVIENIDSEVYYSGLMLNEGNVALQWSSHNEEIANTNILFNLNGIRVKGKDGSYTMISPTEFSGYAQVLLDSGVIQDKRIFTLNADTCEVYKIKVEKQMQIGNAFFVAMSGTKNGLGIFL